MINFTFNILFYRTQTPKAQIVKREIFKLV